jgi:hypothetical protein
MPPPNEDPGTAASPRATSPGFTPVKKTLPKRQLDLLKEHRSYCPYVVRSTLVPSLPSSSSSNPVYGHSRSSSTSSQLNGQTGNGEMEGWRAVLTVLLRYGKAQRQRMGLNYLGAGSVEIGGESENEGMPMEVDGVKSMVAGVKSRGVCVVATCIWLPNTNVHSSGKRSTQIRQRAPELKKLISNLYICTNNMHVAYI